MTNQEFIDFMGEKLQELSSRKMQSNNQARVASIYEEKFKPILLCSLEEHRFMDKFCILKNEVLDEPNDFDIRCCMNNDLIEEAAQKGFAYMQDHSTPEFLDFHKIETENREE